MFQIGASLREARERRGLSSADVQKAIRIRDRYLTALEEERWELLPGDAYVKGFLRTYADFLGLDGSLYVEEYNSRFAHHDDQVIVPQALARRSGGLDIGLARPLVALGMIAVLVGVIAAWQLHGSGGGSPQAGRTGTQQQLPTTTAGTHRRHHPAHHTTTAAALPSRAVLTAARGPVWLQVRSGGASGAILYQNTLAQGRTLPVKLASGPVWIRIGNPPGLDIRLGGKLLTGLPTQPGNVLLTRRGLQPA
jgi:cytoskeleton protein RodZ